MNNNIRKTMAIITLAAVVCLNACSDKTAKEEAVTSDNETTTVIAVQEDASTVADKITAANTAEEEKADKRTVEIDRGNGLYDIYEFNKKGLLIKEEAYDGCAYGGESESSLYITEYEYNENNQVTKEIHTFSSGRVDYYLYKYNENGKIYRSEWHQDSEDTVCSYDEFKYDSAGNLTGKYSYSDDQLIYYTEYAYDSNGKLKTKTYEIESEGYFQKTEYTYDGNGIVLSAVSYDKDGETIGEEKYKNGLLADEWYISSDEFKKEIFSYEYDTDGNMVKRIYHTSPEMIDGLLTGKTTTATFYIKYENGKKSEIYDEYNNITTKFEYFDNGNIVKETMFEEDGTICSVDTYTVGDVTGNLNEIVEDMR